ncbi:hypothetical protein SD70_26925 [Gordoniibacillus kamchatkensis]|uniref:Ger(X)C family spore germination protein n=2 Tax=Gordoniibacillus kamchatkensis TaxID=1590651 RepID=A0ABR5ABC8_9BACL|nr:Ger(x)C family spore germination protein [Paenibacillus sp. VKM B-2647]KIL38370.1 hypothetical protein SD70_26925 [Paenibacillus sp. VKM B-2647]
MRRVYKWLGIFIMLIGLSGCWDLHEIQNIDYITSLGIDFSNNQYTVYAQTLDFSSVAKQESGKPKEPALIWIGKGQGSTLNIAMNDLYNTAQQRLLWNHITHIVVSENALKRGTKNLFEAVERYREIRFTPWIYGTKENIEQLLTTPAFYNLSPLLNISHEPEENYRQKSLVQPIRFVHFLADNLEPGRTVILPSLKINPKQWTKNQKPDPKLQLDGAFVIHEQKLQGWLDIEHLQGLRWLTSETIRSPLKITKDGKTVGVLSLEHPKFRITEKLDGGPPSYSILVKLSGNIVELLEQTDESLLQKLAEKKVEEEIRSTFINALTIESDIYHLEYDTYLNHYGIWKRIFQQQGLGITKTSLKEINVKIQLNHSGMLSQ